MATVPKLTFDTIRNDILQRRFKPVYLLMGDEAYLLTPLLIFSMKRADGNRTGFQSAYILWY